MPDCWGGPHWRQIFVDVIRFQGSRVRIFLLFLIGFLLAVPPSLYAGPASPDTIDIRQPDGTSFKARIHGDEFQAWTISETSGHTILPEKISGYWEYAERAQDGSLRPSGQRVKPGGQDAPSKLPKGLRPPRNLELERHMQQMQNELYQQRLDSSAGLDTSSAATTSADSGADAAPGDWAPVPVSGARKALIVLISFADRAIQTSAASWYSSVFDENAKSVAKFFKDNSFSQLTIAPATHSQAGNPAGILSVTVPDNHPDYGKDYDIATEKILLNHALEQAADHINFASFDTNANGVLEQAELTIYFIYAGYEASGSSKIPNVWAHAYWTTGTGITAGTKNVQRWAQNGELNDYNVIHPMGVIAHELGHALCGLPDLYDVSGQNQAMGGFSLMSTGSWGRNTAADPSADAYSGMTPTALDIWSREFLGWTTPVIPATSGQISLGHVLATTTSAYKLSVPSISSTEYFLVENRQPDNWDKGLRRWLGNGWLGGLLILHVDNTAGSFPTNNINSYTANSTTPGHQGVVPVQANLAGCDMLAVGSSCYGKATTLFYSGNNASWTPATAPNSNYYSGAPSQFSLTSISAQATTMTANLSMLSSPSVSTESATDVFATVARLNGSVNDNNLSTSTMFDYGTTTSYGTSVSGGILPAGSGSVAVSAAISGLSCNTVYHFRVKGTNSMGTSYGGDQSFRTSACVPDAPTITSVVAGNRLARIYFAPPVSDGGSPVTGYTVVPSVGEVVFGDSIPISVSGLTNGVSYTFAVRAINSAGSGQASAVSPEITPGLVIIDNAESTGYPVLQDAYDADVLAEKLKVVGGEAVGDFTVSSANQKGSVLIKGGYDNSFSDDGGQPSIVGKVVLSAGTTRFQNIVVQ